MTWSTKYAMNRLDKADLVSDIDKMPWLTWCLPHASTMPLLFVRLEEGSPQLLKPDGDPMVCAVTPGLWAKLSPVRVLHCSAMKLIGDDRPTLETEEDLDTHFAGAKA